MKTEVVKEVPAFVLRGYSYYTTGEVITVSYTDLRTSDVGDTWDASPPHSNERGCHHEQAELVYKADDGCAILFYSWGSTNERDPKDWAGEPILRWYNFTLGEKESGRDDLKEMADVVGGLGLEE